MAAKKRTLNSKLITEGVKVWQIRLTEDEYFRYARIAAKAGFSNATKFGKEALETLARKYEDL